MFYFEKYLGLCEAGEGGEVILYPGGRFMNGVPLNEQELSAERGEPPKCDWLSGRDWLRVMVSVVLSVVLVKLMPSVIAFIGGPMIICGVLYCIAYLPFARHQIIQRKYPGRSWTPHTPFQREMDGEVVLPKMGRLVLPWSIAGIAFSVFGFVIALEKPVTYANIGMVVSFAFVLTISAAWLVYHIVLPEEEGASR